jgi:hypothetical protein
MPVLLDPYPEWLLDGHSAFDPTIFILHQPQSNLFVAACSVHDSSVLLRITDDHFRVALRRSDYQEVRTFETIIDPDLIPCGDHNEGPDREAEPTRTGIGSSFVNIQCPSCLFLEQA